MSEENIIIFIMFLSLDADFSPVFQMEVQPPPSKTPKVLSEHEKYDVMKKKLDPLVPLFSQLTGNEFEQANVFLDELKQKLLKGEFSTSLQIF